MDDNASVLLGFPPTDPLYNNWAYDLAITAHRAKVFAIAKKTAMVEVAELLELLDPAVNSLSYLVILDALRDHNAISVKRRGEATIHFFTSFDARQIRYIGETFFNYLKHMTKDQFVLPYHVKVGLLANAILRLDPTGSMLTSSHIDLVHLAYDSDSAEFAFSVIDKQIVYYPSVNYDTPASRKTNDKLLCDMDLLPPDYITPETRLTILIDVQNVLEYDYICGLLYVSRRQWKKALAAFERVITHPTRDGGLSQVMTEAYSKWLLLSLIVNGCTPLTPNNAGSNAKKAYETTGAPYLALATHFDGLTAVDLKREADAHAQMWHDARNNSLVQEALAAHQKWQIINLRKVFSKISISQIRSTTCSAETGFALPSDADAERLIQSMIDTKMLNGVIVKPEGKPAYLEYLSEAEELSEADYNKEVAGALKRLKELEALYNTTNARLSTNPHWIKHVIREQKREKENSGQAAQPLGFDSQVEEEDLMTGIQTASL